MFEKANRYDVLAKEFLSCETCGARYPKVNVRSVEYKEKGHFRRKRRFYLIKGRCTSPEYHSNDSDRNFEKEVPYNQYWSTLRRYGITD